ncbi:MAG: alkaline phosphatase D family protein [Flavobacteriaceae bacterium]|nr:alkaline phosphatase D family protein [Flavobacteriaceae bacterium]
MKKADRRSFLKQSLLASAGILIVPNFLSCSNDDDVIGSQIPQNLINDNFNEGVASFDPQSNQVIIWTRYTTSAPTASLVWQISTDQQFENIIRSGEVTTDSTRDFTAAIQVENLQAGLKLYYRFINIADETVSAIGETFTPSTSLSELSIAAVSCSNFQSGFFNVYKSIANSNADVVVHLGDYIYEYATGEFGTIPGFTESAGRAHSPNAEILNLEQYRQRYRQYRQDEDLKELHRKKPFVTVWDDHEVANDAYTDGAENHQSSEGDFQLRKQDALQAYSEYLPLTSTDNSLIYRTLNFGNLVDLIMLDTRIIGRNQQLSYVNYFDNQGNFDAVSFQNDLLNPSRTILGSTQLNWFQNELGNSTSNWQIIGQQVLMTKLLLPVEIIVLLAQAANSPSPEQLALISQAFQELIVIKTRMLQGDPTLTPEEIARVETVLPFNLDAWDGYPIEREIVYAAFANKNVVVLAGDTHNAWENDLKDANGNLVAKEIATSSVSSPGIGEVLGGDPNVISNFEDALTFLVDEMNYTNLANRGYVLVSINSSSVSSEYKMVDTVFSPSFSDFTDHSVTVTT